MHIIFDGWLFGLGFMRWPRFVFTHSLQMIWESFGYLFIFYSVICAFKMMDGWMEYVLLFVTWKLNFSREAETRKEKKKTNKNKKFLPVFHALSFSCHPLSFSCFLASSHPTNSVLSWWRKSLEAYGWTPAPEPGDTYEESINRWFNVQKLKI